MVTRYAHLSEFLPNVGYGAAVTAGQVIGLVGHTGDATGNHIHFEVRINGYAVDPAPFTRPSRRVVLPPQVPLEEAYAPRDLARITERQRTCLCGARDLPVPAFLLGLAPGERHSVRHLLLALACALTMAAAMPAQGAVAGNPRRKRSVLGGRTVETGRPAGGGPAPIIIFSTATSAAAGNRRF